MEIFQGKAHMCVPGLSSARLHQHSLAWEKPTKVKFLNFSTFANSYRCRCDIVVIVILLAEGYAFFNIQIMQVYLIWPDIELFKSVNIILI